MSNETYYLVASRPKNGTALLAWFDYLGEELRAYFIQLPIAQFEKALVERTLVPAEKQSATPPWLAGFEGIDIAAIEQHRRSMKKSYKKRAEERFETIAPLVERHEMIVTSVDPYLMIRRLAAEHAPKQKVARIAPWYLAYMLFGRDTRALWPAFCDIGAWKRSAETLGERKLGRPAATGRLGGHSAIPMAGRIADAYVEFAKEGVSMSAIYGTAMVKTFGCRTRRNSRNQFEYYQPENLPFPKQGQFTYWVKKEFGTQEVQRKKLGDVRYRNKVAVSKGPFSSAVSNILERGEMDGYYVKVVPTALLSDQPDLPLSICRLVCIATGGIAGVGAAYGSEDTDAYRSMLFCAAVDKQWFASLLGLQIGKDDWPYIGLPMQLVGDRGPGESGAIAPDDGCVVLPDRGMTPSYTPQSKGTVESSHPREMAGQGSPSYKQSSLTALGLWKREVMQACADNECSDASSRHTAEMVADGVAANPHAIFRWLNARGRSDAMTIPRDVAIRRYLKPVTFKLNSQGLWLLSLRVDSAALRESGIPNLVRKGQTIELYGFVLPLCVRTCWLDAREQLIELQGQLALRDDDQQLYMSWQELEQHDIKMKLIRSEHREHVPAARSAAETTFSEQTGVDWNAGRRRGGKPPSRSTRRNHGLPRFPRGKRRR